ncbi:nucleoside triphosphate pyrophosphohydrolase [Alkalihalophilus marmarensis]|uniref:Phosphoribosyl-ATP pyrophosphohydrolase n=1 Tax=Alkalihalophilus marmarensis DSM 21297 TaxID=1188261 RepID=U6SQJ8_9BACI|nr:nucleoside triphosphate pyrophosphohydrolase [Alkalihalophilus marmarensis]ERN53989.1 phosphoribosyl-ATP pyrophosphohydrolase [Alkalihalophilus marmarensis DSM 21297]
MPIYNKLVRDRIPEIIEKTGKEFRTDILNKADYEGQLKVKLREEMGELLEADTKKDIIEEMADLLEVVYALGVIHDISPEEMESVRKRKQNERGGFNERIFLIDVEDE